MKRILLAFSLLAAISSQAQTSFGVHGNVIGSNVSTTGDEEVGGLKQRYSWKFGVTANTPLGARFSFNPQLNVLEKGARIKSTGSDEFGGMPFTYNIKGYVKYTYLEIPLNFVYNEPLAKGGTFFIGAGPSVSYGLGGSTSITATTTSGGVTDTESDQSNVRFDGDKNPNDDDVHFKAIELGANFLTGYRFASGLFLNAHVNVGLSNIETEEDAKTKNTYFGIGVGYYFKRKK
ncbi:MAG: hypothetical protein JWP27_2770 [Flaviaesturariibacter sp.]|nr:hypothetical protein [Flaviaesturariibacter sp.]